MTLLFTLLACQRAPKTPLVPCPTGIDGAKSRATLTCPDGAGATELWGLQGGLEADTLVLCLDEPSAPLRCGPPLPWRVALPLQDAQVQRAPSGTDVHGSAQLGDGTLRLDIHLPED